MSGAKREQPKETGPAPDRGHATPATDASDPELTDPREEASAVGQLVELLLPLDRVQARGVLLGSWEVRFPVIKGGFNQAARRRILTCVAILFEVPGFPRSDSDNA